MPRNWIRWSIDAAFYAVFTAWLLLIALAAGYIFLGYWNIAVFFGIDWSIDNFGIILRSGLWLTWILPPLVVLQIGTLILARRKLARHAAAHRCHLCPRCGYSLQSRTDDAQPCPECGQRISRREAIRLWARFCR